MTTVPKTPDTTPRPTVFPSERCLLIVIAVVYPRQH
jgi:hypothetical protein